ncbi:hypothetical protein AA16663_1900 [Komagataeibacter rhaeticus DSM 16663]|nr:hypothetical protein AA16663_1900 [Komagataeibacter rhaeticus DSM 16663]
MACGQGVPGTGRLRFCYGGRPYGSHPARGRDGSCRASSKVPACGRAFTIMARVGMALVGRRDQRIWEATVALTTPAITPVVSAVSRYWLP